MAWPNSIDEPTLVAIVDNEGLSYGVSSYMCGERPYIEDEDIRNLWIEAHRELNEVIEAGDWTEEVDSAILRPLREALTPIMAKYGIEDF